MSCDAGDLRRAKFAKDLQIAPKVYLILYLPPDVKFMKIYNTNQFVKKPFFPLKPEFPIHIRK